MSQLPEQSDLQIKSVTLDGKAPKKRSSTIASALTGYQSMVNADIIGGRGVRFGCIAGLAAGFPPNPPSEMERQGMGDMPNFNTREFDAGATDYCDVTLGVHCGNVQWFDVEADNPDPLLKQSWSEYLTKCFNEAIGIWDDPVDDGFFCQSGRYILESSIRDRQMCLYNIGVCMFRGPRDFRFTTIPTRKVFVPEGTKITLDNCSAIYIQDDMSASQLWNLRDQTGWDKEQITKLLYYNKGSNEAYNAERWTYAQWVQWTVENESFILTDFLPIPIVHQYIMEYGGRISHSVFSPQLCDKAEKVDRNGKKEAVFKDKANGSDIGSPGWLYDAPENTWAHTWSQVISLFCDSVGEEGKYHGAKGWGDKNYDIHHQKNITATKIQTAAIINGMLMFTSTGEADKQKMDQIVITQGGILLPDLQIQQLKMNVDLQGMIMAGDQLNRITGENNRKFPIGARSKTGDALTATQVNTDTAKEAQFTNLQIVQYRATGLDKLGAEMYRRIAQPASKYPEESPGGKVAKYFRDKCKEFGIPEKALLKVRSVRANRNSGSGSMPIDLMKGKELLAVATPGEGQRNAQHKIAVALVGSEAANAYVQPIEQQPNEIAREISNENLFISDGKVPLALPTDAHEVHVPAHIQLLSELQKIVMAMQEQGITPDTLDDAVLLSGKVSAGIQHTGQHLEYMMQMKAPQGGKPMYEQIVKEAAKILNELDKMNQGLEKEIEKVATEAQQQQAQQSPEMMKAQMDVQISQMKAEAEIANKKAMTEAKIAMEAMKAQVKAELAAEMKLSQHQMNLGLKAEDTVATQEMTRAKSMEDRMAQAAADEQKLRSQAASSAIDLTTQVEKSAVEIKAAKAKAEAAPAGETK